MLSLILVTKKGNYILSIKNILEYDYIRMIVRFDNVSDFIHQELGMKKSNKNIIIVLKYLKCYNLYVLKHLKSRIYKAFYVF